MPIIPNDTLSYVQNLVNRANLAVISDPSLSSTPFNLDSSGVAGFFGGESSVRATATVNLVAHRRWFGWYNSPGSYEVARQYSGLAKSHLFDALFPVNDSNPAKILMVDGRVGPDHTPLFSTTDTAPSTIGHLGSLIARKISQMAFKGASSQPERGEDAMETRRVTFVRLSRIPLRKFNKLKLASSSYGITFAIGTILISIGGCIACALIADWFSFASIALGIIANGVAGLVIGSGELYLKHNPPAQVDTPGDVLLMTDTDIIILVGSEGVVSPFTRGRFDVRFRGVTRSIAQPTPPLAFQSDGEPAPQVASQSPTQPTPPIISQPNATPQVTSQVTAKSTPDYQHNLRSTAPHSHSIPMLSEKYIMDFSVILLLSQFLAQLLLIPQGRLFGQLMFIATLLASWICNSYLSSISLNLQTDMLFEELSVSMEKDIYQYELNTRMEAVVFACLFFRHIHPLDLKDREEADKALENAENSLAEVERRQAAIKKNLAEVEDDLVEEKLADKNMDDAEKNLNEAKANLAEVVEKKLAEAEKKLAEAQKKLAETKLAEAQKAKKAKEARRAAGPGWSLIDVEKARGELKALGTALVEKQMDQKAKKKTAAMMAEAAKNASKSFEKLLDALLPSKIDVYQAFKESLVRKIGETEIDPFIDPYDNASQAPPFSFGYGDRFVTAANGEQSKLIDRENSGELITYQRDAERALGAWKAFYKDNNISGLFHHYRSQSHTIR